MSGANNQGPPNRLTPIAGDQPMGYDPDGRPIQWSAYSFQMIQRILSFLGQPGQGSTGGGSGTSLTVSEQLTMLNNAVTMLQAAAGAPAGELSSRLADVEALLASAPWDLATAPGVPSHGGPPFWAYLSSAPSIPGAASGSGLTAPQVMARVDIGY